MTKKYKYECRPCPRHVRRQCIQEAQISPGIQRIIERAFESHTDTQDTWDLLHRHCLLELRDQVIIGRQEAEEEGGLLGRIRKKQTEEPLSPSPAEPEPDPPVVTPPSQRQPDWKPNWEAEMRAAREEREEPLSIERVVPRRPASPPPRRPPATRSIKPKIQGIFRTPRQQEPESPSAEGRLRYPQIARPAPAPDLPHGTRILAAQMTGHRIRLPKDGELVLGRFDPLTRVTPDVDLTFEDHWNRGISRRHAQISGWRGQYEIVDLGSSNGTWVNGERLDLQEKHPLQVGDEIWLGKCVLFFAEPPPEWHAPPDTGRHFLYVTFTGHFYPLPDQETITIGRGDPSLGYKTDIDLSEEGDVAAFVSRRHVKLTRKQETFIVEDLGSAYKTRVDGHAVPLGVQMELEPGQHLWLGGCTLAFDIA